MQEPDFDVVVVGFGPSGAVAASLLGQAGLRTLVIDRSRTVYEKPRAIAIDHEILRVLQNLGVGEKVLPHVAPFPASEHFGAKGQLIRRIDMVPPPYPLGYIPTMVFTQPPVEAVLRAHAASYACVEIALGVEFRSLAQAGDRVALHLCDDGGTVRDVTARYVVACDGASSSVRQFVGIGYEDLVFDEPWLVVDVLVDDAALAKLPHTAAQFCEPERPSTFIVGPGNHRRWEIMLLPGEDPHEMQREDRVWQLLARWLAPDDGTLWRASSYRFHALVAEEWRRERVFIAGDAAHQQPPFIGQGMCQGIRDVVNLVWKLQAVLAGEAAETLLDTYGEERGAHVRTLTSRIKAIGHHICERDPAAAAARDERLIAEGGGQARTVTRQEIVPPLDRGLLSATPHPANGTLFPQPWIVTENGERRMDEILGHGWRIVWDGRRAARADQTAPGVATLRVSPPDASPDGDAVVERDGVLAAWFDRHDCAAAVIRPDHYVFGIAAKASDALPLLRELAGRLETLAKSLAEA